MVDTNGRQEASYVMELICFECNLFVKRAPNVCACACGNCMLIIIASSCSCNTSFNAQSCWITKFGRRQEILVQINNITLFSSAVSLILFMLMFVVHNARWYKIQ